MGIPDDNLARTAPILTALVTAISGIQWTPDTGPAEAAFETVSIYDLQDLFTAMKELVAAKSRVALVVFEGSSIENLTQGHQLHSQEIRRVTVLVADRNWGDRKKGFMGDSGSPGAYRLGDLLKSALPGPLDGVGQVYVRCTGIEPMMIQGQDRQNQVGRGAVAVALEICGGEKLTELRFRTY